MVDTLKEFTVKAMSGYLVGLGIYPNSAGYRHILDAVYIAAAHSDGKLQTCKLYAEAGKMAGKSGAAVERAIRNAICRSMNENRMYRINEYFDYVVYSDAYPIRSGEFISLFATKIRNDYEEHGSDHPDTTTPTNGSDILIRR